MLKKPDSALLIIAHGSTLNPDSSAPTFAHAETIRQRAIFKEVYCAFWKEEPSLRQVLHMTDCEDIYIVPNFISEGYFTRSVIPRELNLTGPVTHLPNQLLKYCDPVGSNPAITQILLKCAAAAAPDVPPAQTSLLIVAHGTNLNDQSAAAAAREADRIRNTGLYAQVLNTYMETPPFIADWDQYSTQENVVVLPFFIADGLHSYQDIPLLLGIDSVLSPALSQSNIFRQNPHHIRGRKLYYAGAIGTDPCFADLILEQVEAFDSTHQGTRL